MISNLTTEQRKQVEQALLNAFDYDSIRRMLRLEAGVKIEDEVNINRGRVFIFSDLVELAENGGWLEKLLLGAYRYKSGNLMLNNVVQTLGVNVTQNVQVNQPESTTIDTVLPSSTLEKILNERSSFQRFNDFTNNLRYIGSQICRIEFPEGISQGTGWLVGPNLILTAYHVIMHVHKQSNGFTSKDIICRFDYTNETTGINTLNNRICHLAESWLIDYSPYALADLSQSGEEPTEDELDYALLKLDEPVGNESLSQGSRRGWIKVPENPIVMMQANDIMFIPQHPQGRPLELAFGNVLNYNSKANRLRYNTNTESGSSGSPCFDINLRPFGLHHAAGPNKTLLYNQCVPLRQIVKRMKKNLQVPIFWINNV